MTVLGGPATPAPARGRPLGARSVDEILQACEGRPRFIADGLIHSTATLVFGPSGAGKTWLMAALVAAIADGQPWFGHEVDGPRNCLILAADPDGEREYAERVAACLTGDARTRISITVPPKPEPTEWERVAHELLLDGVELVVLDNLYSWAGEIDIIKNAEVARPLACIRALTDLGIAVVLVHHTNYSAKKAAGVHSITAFFRHQVFVAHDRLETWGNGTGAATLWLTRDAGQIVEVHDVRPAGCQAAPMSVATVTKSRTKIHEKRQRAQAHLEQAQGISSDHQRGAFLAQRMTDIPSPGAGRKFVERMREAGWTVP